MKTSEPKLCLLLRSSFMSSLNTSIARAITISVPLIPQETTLHDLLEDITKHQFESILNIDL